MSADVSKLLEYWSPEAERCGFVLKDGTIVEVPNISETPTEAYLVHVDDLSRYLDEIVATWHSHNTGTGNLSVADYQNFLNWPDWRHYIVEEGRVWSFYVEGEKVFLD